MRILKFGGSSVRDDERILSVIDIVYRAYLADPHTIVVVSAFQGVTDGLINIGTIASSGSAVYAEELDAMRERHYTVAQKVVESGRMDDVEQYIDRLFHELSDTLHGVMLIRELSERTLDLIMSYGERLSAYIISAAMRSKIPSSNYVDARKYIVINRLFGVATVDEDRTNALLKKEFSNCGSVPIFTGFIASSSAGETTTLGRGGSDFTAAIVGAALGADAIEIWTDVDGVMTADPRKVPQAFPLSKLSYEELMEMSHFGAKVVHPPTIAPAMRKNIPIWIKNSFNPDAPGTEICLKVENTNHSVVRGITSIDNVSLLRLEGSGMIGVCGVASRLFGSLAKNNISVIMITQASSEYSICFAVLPEVADSALKAVDAEFALERHAGIIADVQVMHHVSIVAAVGEGMHESTGTAGRLFGALGKNGINVIAIAQGSSEYNITCIVRREDEKKALNVIHSEFFLSKTTVISLFQIGVGLIGEALLRQIAAQKESLRKDYGLEIRVCGLSNSKKMIFAAQGLSLDLWQENLEKSTMPASIKGFMDRMREMNLANAVFVDCTANAEVAAVYDKILSANIAIVTPNKRANSGSYQSYLNLQKIVRNRGISFYYETNVGAGLPIISTLHDMQLSGDRVVKIEAVLSGTLSYIFNHFIGERSFVDVVKEAQREGFTEPDPREDLNGMDVARKILILARECGYPLELDDVIIEPILPQECYQLPTIKEFYAELPRYSKLLIEKKEEAEKSDKVLRHMATFAEGKAIVQLQAVGKEHPFYNLSGSDNIIAIHTERYRRNPIVIKGQGAGAEVTAGGVFADIIRTSRMEK
jgi:aspartokinase/homoserine dehydrogenase 1